MAAILIISVMPPTLGRQHAGQKRSPRSMTAPQLAHSMPELSDVQAPTRGMTMDQVAVKFGAPVSKTPPVGKPPISRWEYPGFVVYFEHEHVIHSVVANS